MSKESKLLTSLSAALAPALFGVALLATPSIAVAAPCTGPGAPSNTQTKCVTAIHIPGAPLQSFDISWVNPERAEYYLADRANKGVDIIDTENKVFKKRIDGFVGIVLRANGTVNNDKSGPAGVVSRGKCLYVGDGDSTLKVIDLDKGKIVAVRSTFGPLKTRVDEMAVTSDGKFLIAANNAEDPPFVTQFKVNEDDEDCDSIDAGTRITVDHTVIPAGFGLSIEQPTWDPKTKRFYTAIPTIADNPAGCNYGQLPGDVTCSGGLLVTDPHDPDATEGLYDPVENTGVIKLNSCGPNGATVGPHDNLLLGCTPGNLPSGKTTLVINATSHNYAQVANITGSDEVWFNKGDKRYYTGSNNAIKPAGSKLGRGSVLGVIDGTSVLIETIPQSSGSHSVAADSERNLIFVPQNYTSSPTAVPLGDQNFTAGAGSATVGQLICGGTDGCIAVYAHDVDEDGEGEHHKDN